MNKAEFVERLDVSRETLERLEVYESVLSTWNPRINLVSAATMADLWSRHFLDSAQLFALGRHARHWADLGSGGGFPGAVVGILANEQAPKMKVTLVEADQRKAAFLRTVARETGVSFRVIAKRIEQAEPLGADVISARALAPLNLLLEFADRHLAPGGTALFLKGENADAEIKQALEEGRFDCEKHPSATDAHAKILKLGAIERV